MHVMGGRLAVGEEVKVNRVWMVGKGKFCALKLKPAQILG